MQEISTLEHAACPVCYEAGQRVALCGTDISVFLNHGETVGQDRCVVCFSASALTCSHCETLVIV